MAQSNDAVTVRDRTGTYRIRSAREADLAGVLNLYRAMHMEYERFGAPKVSREPAIWRMVKDEILLPMIRSDASIIFVAVTGAGGIVGFASGLIYTYAPPYVGGRMVVQVSDDYVHRSARGGTLAVRLQRAVTGWGKSLGCTAAEATFLQGNRSALLLAREGYVPYSTEVHKDPL